MRYFRKITGEQLYLSPFDADDTEIYTKWAEWMNDRTVADNFGEYQNLVSTANAKKILGELKGYRFAIILLDNDVLIGHVSLHDINHLCRNAFLGIFIGEEKYRGKGYGSEAIRLVLDYGFNTLNLHNIMLSVHADNNAAIFCYKKAGFQEAGRRREWVFKNGKYIDKIYMDMLAREFKEQGDEGLKCE
ncbi:MAG: GNAT family N-acetyltransferase [Clostridiales bacterium]|jgi:RimJ/RimL family protein N-acetyltransferase|nr:GNAT family N-acetyltransferase [Clostridiales bacterium]